MEGALREVLCHGTPTRTYKQCPGPPPRGFFAQLNWILELVDRDAHKGRRPPSLPAFYHTDCLGGYGSMRRGIPLEALFEPLVCSDTTPRRTVARAVAILRSSPRYLVVSRLAWLLFRPRAAHIKPPPPTEGWMDADVAVHVRRGDKLMAPPLSPYDESIQFWDEARVASAVMQLLERVDGSRVLIASDDGEFAHGVERRLLRWQNVTVEVRPEHVAPPAPRSTRRGGRAGRQRGRTANVSTRTAQVTAAAPSVGRCTAACVPPLLALTERFARARALLVSTKSNMGSYFLTRYAATNADMSCDFSIEYGLWYGTAVFRTQKANKKHGYYYWILTTLVGIQYDGDTDTRVGLSTA